MKYYDYSIGFVGILVRVLDHGARGGASLIVACLSRGARKRCSKVVRDCQERSNECTAKGVEW